MEKFCEMHAPGLFNEVYTSILNESKEMPEGASTSKDSGINAQLQFL